jgi:hypothetical protein
VKSPRLWAGHPTIQGDVDPAIPGRPDRKQCVNFLWEHIAIDSSKVRAQREGRLTVFRDSQVFKVEEILRKA